MNSLFVIFRSIHYVTAMLVFGELVFALLVVGPFLRPSQVGGFHLHFSSRFAKVVAYCLAGAIASGAAWLLVEAANMSGLPLKQAIAGETIGLVLGHTVFGLTFAARAGLIILLGSVLVFISRLSDNHFRLRLGFVALVLAAAYLGSLAAAGHALAAGESGNLSRVIADVAHLLAAGAWLGSLPALVHALGQSGSQAQAAAMLRRFSTLGLICVGLLIASGMVNSWYQVGSIPALVGSDYGRLLTAKLLLFMVMLVFAAINRGASYAVGIGVLTESVSGRGDPALRLLRRNALFEIALGLAVVILVAALGVLVPAAHEPVVWPFDYTLSLEPILQTAWMQLVVAGTAAIGGIAGITLIAGALARPPRVRWLAVAGLLIPVLILVVLLRVPAHPTTYMISTVPYAADAIETGSTLYAENCSSCHGQDGRELNLNELTQKRREGELYGSVAQGIPGTAMPGFAPRLAEVEIWSLIQFLDAQVAAHNAAALTERLKAVAPVPAPDFTYEFIGQEQSSLRQQRDQGVLLLVIYSVPASLPRLRELAALESAYTNAGAVVIAVPMPASAAATVIELKGGGAAMLAFTSPAVASTYLMFARQAEAVAGGTVEHVEYLIDRYGYIRTRRMGVPETAASSSAELLQQIDALMQEPPPDQVQWGHRH